MTSDQAAIIIGVLSILVYALGFLLGVMVGEWE
jgi:hypothetical protein